MGFVEPSCVWSGWRPDPTQIILRLFFTHCESCAQDVENVTFFIRVCYCQFLIERTNYTVALCIFPWNPCEILVKSLQLCGRRQIAKPRKYCLMYVIVFLWRVFSLFCFSQVGNFRLIPYSIIKNQSKLKHIYNIVKL